MTYHGGDLKGLTEKVSYLKDLGINTIWITPIVENTDFNQMFAKWWTAIFISWLLGKRF